MRRFLSMSRGTTLGKVRLYLLMRNAGARVIQGFLHLRAEPDIVLGSAFPQREG